MLIFDWVFFLMSLRTFPFVEVRRASMSAGGTLPLLSMDPQKIDMEWSNLPSGELQGDESWENDYSVALKYADKNRYSDVLPFNESRVSLEPSESNPDGYINANVIELPSSQAIATQGPLPQTFSEFWQMIWVRYIQGRSTY